MTRERADLLAGAKAHDRKLAAAALVKASGLPLSLNVVLHRQNHDQLAGIVDLAERMGTDRLELANTQYYGWALRNRDALMPTPAQLAAAEPIVRAAVERLRGTMEIVYVVAGYYEPYPKPCMYGWGARQLTVAPDGTVLPCPVASAIKTLPLSNVLGTPLAESWYGSDSFNAYRVAKTGRPSRAARVTGAASTSVAAAARRSCSPATPRPPTRCAHGRHGEMSSTWF